MNISTNITNNHSFDCVSLQHEVFVPEETTGLYYLVTKPNLPVFDQQFDFVYQYFSKIPYAFNIHQPNIISLAKSMFSESKPLDNFESAVLMETFISTSSTIPTLKGRK